MIELEIKKIYIAGKITDDEFYEAKFCRVAAVLRKEGYVALNPATLPKGMNNADYMRICFAMIDSADAVVFLPDWHESRGARLERAYCEYIGKEIIK